jgi:hypothetical protein
MTIEELFSELTVDDDANRAQNQTCDYLKNRNYKCEKEVFVPDRGDGYSGYIDIVAIKGNERIAVEFDRKSPRVKSLIKLQSFNATNRVVLLRGGNKSYTENGIDVLSVRLRR